MKRSHTLENRIFFVQKVVLVMSVGICSRGIGAGLQYYSRRRGNLDLTSIFLGFFLCVCVCCIFDALLLLATLEIEKERDELNARVQPGRRIVVGTPYVKTRFSEQ